MPSEIRPMIIPVFLPHEGCPHRCVFCNQFAMDTKPVSPTTPDTLFSHVKQYLAFQGKDRFPVETAFYGGNFLGLEKARQRLFLEAAAALAREGVIHGIRFSTRPDTISTEGLAELSGFPVTLVELGVQSMEDRVLNLSQRGHTAADTLEAAAVLKASGLRFGMQLMVGLPGDTESGTLNSAEKIAALSPECVRIYPTVVLKGSRLADWYSRGLYTPMPLDRCIRLVKKLYLFFSQQKIRVIRMGLQSSETLKPEKDLIDGPYHPAFGHLVLSEIFQDLLVSFLEKTGKAPDPLRLHLHPSHASRVAGHGNRTLALLKTRFGIGSVTIQPEASCPRDLLFIGDAAVPIPL